MPIRNFSIIAHIDHGKSTLADRLLEVTKTVEKRRMRAQYLDMMELERERGITIKMQPVRMTYELAGETYNLNLIDTPGHIDFSYEVSRALAAVEGAVLLVDATKGVQAQTLSVLHLAQMQKLTIIPVINKIDLPAARVAETTQEIMTLLHCGAEEILTVSAKTGSGVEELLRAVIERIPPPSVVEEKKGLQGLVFDFEYSPHRGVIVYHRLFRGEIKAGDELGLAAAGTKFKALEVGVFAPEKKSVDVLRAGEIGYVVTGIKEVGRARV
ncbi:MAG: GTP-binding protein, partial [Patescibacteria group bacterium]